MLDTGSLEMILSAGLALRETQNDDRGRQMNRECGSEWGCKGGMLVLSGPHCAWAGGVKEGGIAEGTSQRTRRKSACYRKAIPSRKGHRDTGLEVMLQQSRVGVGCGGSRL